MVHAQETNTQRWAIKRPLLLLLIGISIPVRVCFLFAVYACRSCSDRAVKLEASVETYRRKLEDLGDLRRQVKQLEEKNMTYMYNTVSLEEELSKANAARTQLETYKRQVWGGGAWLSVCVCY